MKKLVLAGAVALFGMATAQTAAPAGFQGRTFISGQVGYNNKSITDVDGSQSTYSIIPVVGHFIAPTVAIGAGIGYQGTTEKIDSDNKETTSAFVFQPLIRKYWSVANSLYIFGQFDVPMAWGSTKTTVNGHSNDSQKYSSFGFFVRPGLDYFLTPNWSVEATVGALGYNSEKPNGGKSTNDFSFGLNFAEIKLGAKYIF